jgi:hypothetical protein
MSTVSKKIADEVIAQNGRYEGDPQVYSIWKYTSKWNTEGYKLFYKPNMYLSDSKFTIDPRIYWSYDEQF